MSRILVLGTSSGAGKTTFCAMLCRYLARRGLDPVPFKGLNLSLNSYATADGGEIGIGQAFQAWSAGLEPETDMNPVLLKPSGGGVTQLVLNGRPSQDVSESAPMDRKGALEEAAQAFGRLSERHGFVVCEGSGSPVELNIMDGDVANVGLMRRLGVDEVNSARDYARERYGGAEPASPASGDNAAPGERSTPAFTRDPDARGAAALGYTSFDALKADRNRTFGEMSRTGDPLREGEPRAAYPAPSAAGAAVPSVPSRREVPASMLSTTFAAWEVLPLASSV